MPEMTSDEIDQRLAFIGSAAVGVCRVATRAGAKYLSERIADAAPSAEKGRRVNGEWVEPGGMKRSIGYNSLKASTGMVGAKAGVDVGRRKKDINKARHGHFYLLGTVDRWTGFVRVRVMGKAVDVRRTKSMIRFRGRMTPGVGFVEYATRSADAEVQKIVTNSIIKGIERAANKQGLQG